ncbi:hypothetical protein APB26_31730 [Pseudomonas aeruginosa]|uniref:DsbA family protein n=1 Tax=Pseudomonas aeruginosa TaxID=287 RepID=UPI00071B40C0|nr:thioredoxin domain-containing protein [Pseudomonas aeruginosa]KSQ21561.1 hypothetical protein APB26_31730 [Pseudomonas aeruginosa]RPV61229.1 hypothetical protein IPC838_18055 [Pseudomonas aeruginosa]
MKKFLKSHGFAIVTSVVLSQAISAAGLAAYLQSDLYSQRFTAQINTAVAAKEKVQIDEYKTSRFEDFKEAPASVPNDARIYGSLSARFTLAEFSDMECPYCKGLQGTLKEIVDRSNGAVNWQFRHMPLAFHNPAATTEAHAAECYSEQFGNQGFWVMVDEIFLKSGGNGAGLQDLEGAVRKLGADMDKFQSCMASNRYKDHILDQAKLGAKLGITGTPATVVIDNLTNKKMFVKGNQPRKEFIDVMKQMLAESKANEANAEAKSKGEEVDTGRIIGQQLLNQPSGKPAGADE